MLTLSMNILPLNKQFRVQVNEEQVILDTLLVLEGKGLLQDVPVSKHTKLQSERSKERFSPLLSYAQANIYTGDILYVGERDVSGTNR